MKYERINKNYTKIIISFIIIIIIGSVLVLNITKAKYKTTVSVPIVSGTVNYSGGYDFKIMALYQQKNDKICTEDECYDSIEEMPDNGYKINKTKSYCTLDGENKEYDKLETINGIHSIRNLKKNEKCYLYFDVLESTRTLIQLGLHSQGKIESFDGTACNETCDYLDENGVYETEDDFGTSYYFRGTINNNWVKFGTDSSQNDIYWRIIRINGDGTIRLIYSGSGTPAETGEKTNAITNQRFNPSYDNDSRYVGYEFKPNDMHGYGTGAYKSEALSKLNTWFKNNLADEWNSGNGRIDTNAGFCNDRSGSTDPNATWSENMIDSGGTGTTSTHYGGYLRLRNSPRQPTLKCSTNYYDNKNKDYFTYTGATGIDSTANGKITGTKSLEYPIGLITADEVAFAGGVYEQVNENFWLNTGQDYWIMTPCYISGPYIFYETSNGMLYSNYTDNNYKNLRPVINLKADTTFTFEHPDQSNKGTSSNPYIVSN